MSYKLCFWIIPLSLAAACGRTRGSAGYRKQDPASDSIAITLPPGQAIYDTLCATCHAGSGVGQPGAIPPLAHSSYVTGNPSTLISIILHGMAGPVTIAGSNYNGLMPAWGDSLSDQQIAAVATYLRRSWGNSEPGITPATVAAIRSATSSRRFPWTPRELFLAPTDAH